MKSIKLENVSNTYSLFNSVKFDTSDVHDKYLLYTHFVVWYCKGSSIAPLSDYAYNPVYQELLTQKQYFTTTDEKIFIDLRRGKGYTNEIEKLNRDDSDLLITITLKTLLLLQKMRLRVSGYYQGKYLYSLLNEGLIMNYKEYSVNMQQSIVA